MPKAMAPIVYAAVCGLHGLLYGVLYAPAQALMYGLSFEATLAWIASRPGVTSVIPGARSTAQATANAAAGDLAANGFDTDAFDALVRDVYDRRLRAEIHPQW